MHVATAWVPISQFARHCGISVVTARRWADDGLVEVRYTVGGHRRFLVTDAPRPSRLGATPPSTYAGAKRSLPEVSALNTSSPSRSMSNEPHDRVKAMFRRFAELRASGEPVAVTRLDDSGSHHLVTIPSELFSLQWVKEGFGGGRFEANGVEFLIEGAPRTGKAWA